MPDKNYPAARQAVFARYQPTRQHTYHTINRLHAELTTLCDSTFTQLWHTHGPGSNTELPPCALLATGGYGRQSLFPHSDLDILVLLPDGIAAAAEHPVHERISDFLNACWDAGINLAPSVRDIDTCAREAAADITIQTTLLESRLLCGNPALAQQMRATLRQALNLTAFTEAKLAEMQARHLRFDETAYALEPNCKESPGGLRDLHTILWIARACQLGTSWLELHHSKVITEHEYRQLRRHWARLAWVRTRLHWLTGRDENRLLFTHQSELAHSFGYTGIAGSTALSSRQAGEVLMRRYYWTAKAVEQLRDIVLMSMHERLRKNHRQRTQGFELLGGGFIRRDNMLDLADPALYRQRPQAILETYYHCATHPRISRLSAQTLRALFNARPIMGAAFRADPANRSTFMRILKAPAGQTRTLRLMNSHSVLGRYLWAFRKTVGQMQYDLFHVYTVDQHTLMVLRNMRRFFISRHNTEHPLCSELAQQWHKPWLLYIACLFHDIGKGRGGDHSTIGAAEVAQFCRDHHISAHDTDTLTFLVAAHLDLSRTAQKKDISDPDVIRSFAKQIGTRERLTALYLLTVADVKGTNPTAWNSWKGKLFEDLYRSTLRALGGALGDARAEAERKKKMARQRMAALTVPPQAEQHLWQNLDRQYFLRHDSSDIAWHARHISKALHSRQPPHALVRCRLPENHRSHHGGTADALSLQIMVYTPDQPDCFARICACLHELNCNILDAKIHTTGNGCALDTFQVINPDASIHPREMMSLIEQSLPRALAPAANRPLPAPKTARLSARARTFPASSSVTIHPDPQNPDLWIITIGCNDRMGLLFNIARTLAHTRLNIHAARITTLGERVEDTFEVHSRLLSDPEQRRKLQQALLHAIDNNSATPA